MNLVVLPAIIPLFAAGLALLAHRSLSAQRIISFAANLAALAAAVALLADVAKLVD